MKLEIVRLISSDRQWTEEVFQTHWGAGVVVSRGKVHRASDLDGYVACSGKERVGLATFVIQKDQCEIVTLNSFVEGQGIGTALVNAVQARARKSGCRRVWLITTNDNLNALRFYQRRGFSMVCVHRNAVQDSRKIKPEIPEIGEHGIRVQDEIEMEMIISK